MAAAMVPVAAWPLGLHWVSLPLESRKLPLETGSKVCLRRASGGRRHSRQCLSLHGESEPGREKHTAFRAVLLSATHSCFASACMGVIGMYIYIYIYMLPP